MGGNRPSASGFKGRGRGARAACLQEVAHEPDHLLLAHHPVEVQPAQAEVGRGKDLRSAAEAVGAGQRAAVALRGWERGSTLRALANAAGSLLQVATHAYPTVCRWLHQPERTLEQCEQRKPSTLMTRSLRMDAKGVTPMPAATTTTTS